MQRDIISTLISRFVAGTLTNEESLQLNNAIKNAEPADYEWLLEHYEKQIASIETLPDADEGLFNKIRQRIADIEEERVEEPVVRKWYYAAAAVLLLGIVITGVRLYKPANKVAVIEYADIQPGGNKAILQLADGSRIQLDSGNKIINTGGQAIKQNNGLIQYTSADGKTVTYNVLTTPRGGQFQVVLADGSKVTLNAASSLRFPTEFTGTERKVILTGEAYFEVAADEKHPFKVQSGSKEIEVLGTEFNVMAYSDEPNYQATLVTGKIRVDGGNDDAILAPGAMAEVNNSDGKLSTKTVDIEQVTAWKNGILALNGQSFDALMRQVERWYDVEVKYEGAIPNRKFGALMGRNTQLSRLIQFMKQSGVNIRQEGRTIIIMP